MFFLNRFTSDDTEVNKATARLKPTKSAKGPVVRTIPLPGGGRMQALREDIYQAALLAVQKSAK